MQRGDNKPGARRLRSLLTRDAWVYLLCLLIPFVAYDLVLKASLITSRPETPGLPGDLGLMRSDMLFNVGYALFWIGLFAAARKGPLRWAVVVLFHVSAVLVLTIMTVAHRYYQENGTTLDYSLVAEWIPKFGELAPILTRDVPLLAWMVLAAALLYAILGPWLLTRAVGRWRGRPQTSPADGAGRTSLLGSIGLFLLALGFGFLSLLIGPGPAGSSPEGVGKSFARDPFVNVAVTGVEQVAVEGDGPVVGEGSLDTVSTLDPPKEASLAETPRTEERNVVLIHLESTRAQSVTPYNEDLKTTPFLDELARQSLLVERSYTTVPRSSKASVAVNCGIEPPLYPGPEFEPDGIPSPCLADLLKEQGYSTVFFASTFANMDNFGDVVQGFGYEEFYPAETLDQEGYQITNTFGYEDDIMLGPSEEWLESRDESKSFLAEYFTGTGHYGYECTGLRTGFEDFAEDEELNRYLNCLRYLDSFVERIFDQYKEMGLYEDTIFVVYGDHGEGFNEHDRSLHGDTIYEEGLKVPLLIHDPKRFRNGERLKGLSNQIDILPTVLDLLGYRVEDGEYPGYSLLGEPPEDRTLMSSCITNRKCLASIKGDEKYIYHYGDQPEEIFNLSEDPLEERNLAGEYSSEELNERREELLAWRSRVNAAYGGEG